MVDFKKLLKASSGKQPLVPSEIYDRLDRESDKGPLRPAQDAVLDAWHKDWRDKRDVIVKLHTGQGKTLIGLVLLQSKLNEGVGPALYLCPDNFLVDQTAVQAKQFGIEFCTAIGSADLPDDFLNSKSILICTVQKLFNGRSKFGIGARSVPLGALVVDDAHACIDSIREASTVRLERAAGAYAELVRLFASGLQSQGLGTFADLENGNFDALLPVPYWEWIQHSDAVAAILSKYGDTAAIKFAWPLIKDILPECDCLVSGQSLEISPRLAPMDAFGSYTKAKHRVFMSATISDDSFFIKGLDVSKETVTNPLTYSKEKWSGEKMVVIPSMLSETLNRKFLVERFAKPDAARKFGVVVLVPSFKQGDDWKNNGATVADRDTIEMEVKVLRSGKFEKTLVIANRYDGVDLPDNSCRILILDSRPFGESLLERHLEQCLPSSDALAARLARTIEQGMGRSVRGEKDFSVILLVGPELVRAVRDRDARAFLSAQTRKQVEIGLLVAGLAKDEIEKEAKKPSAVFAGLILQSLRRDEGWKDFYTEEMNRLASAVEPPKRLEIFEIELKSELLARDGRYEEAAAAAQKLADKFSSSAAEEGWYLQQSARHLYRANRMDAEKLQTAAHKRNRLLLRPITRAGLTPQLQVAQKRVEQIIDWVRKHEDAAAVMLTVESILTSIRFGVDADSFESAFDRLGRMLGFACERPDKEWKEGPDNLWRLRDDRCLLVECKTEISQDRKEIAKYEAEQMNQSYAWFKKTYPGLSVECVMVIPPRKLGGAASLLQRTTALQKDGLERLCKNVRAFFSEFLTQDLNSLAASQVQKALEKYQLGLDDLLSTYTSAITGAGLPQ